MILGVLILILIIVLAVILCIKTNDYEKVIIKEENKEVEIYAPNIYQTIDYEVEEIELINSDLKKAEINQKLGDEIVQSLINSKIISRVYKDRNIIINEFNSGNFTDEEKFKLLYSKFDYTDEVDIYTSSPSVWIDTDEIQKASVELFGESINILNLKNLVIKDGKIEYTLPTDFSIQIFKVKSVILDKSTNMYIIKFDMLKYNASYVPYDIVKYDENDVVATFEMKANKVDNNYVIKQLNKI